MGLDVPNMEPPGARGCDLRKQATSDPLCYRRKLSLLSHLKLSRALVVVLKLHLLVTWLRNEG